MNRPDVIRSVVLDFDGTLYGSVDESLAVLTGILRGHGIELTPSHRAAALEVWGGAGSGFISRIFKLDAEHADRIYQEWEAYDAAHVRSLITGTEETLTWCYEMGIIPCLLTSRWRRSLDPILKHHRLDRAFRIVTAHDDTPHRKPDARALDNTLAALAEHGIGKSDIVLVGDTRFDIMTGRDSGVHTLVVETGPYRESHVLINPVPDHCVLPSIADFPAWADPFVPT